MGQIHSICGHSAQLLVVLFPNKGDIIRNEVKRWGDVEHGQLQNRTVPQVAFANISIKVFLPSI